MELRAVRIGANLYCSAPSLGVSQRMECEEMPSPFVNYPDVSVVPIHSEIVTAAPQEM